MIVINIDYFATILRYYYYMLLYFMLLDYILLYFIELIIFYSSRS